MCQFESIIAAHVTQKQAELDRVVIDTHEAATREVRAAFCADLEGDTLRVAQIVAAGVTVEDGRVVISESSASQLRRAFAARILPGWEETCCGAADINSSCEGVRYFMRDGRDPRQSENPQAPASVAVREARAATVQAQQYRDANR